MPRFPIKCEVPGTTGKRFSDAHPDFKIWSKNVNVARLPRKLRRFFFLQGPTEKKILSQHLKRKFDQIRRISTILLRSANYGLHKDSSTKTTEVHYGDGEKTFESFNRVSSTNLQPKKHHCSQLALGASHDEGGKMNNGANMGTSTDNSRKKKSSGTYEYAPIRLSFVPFFSVLTVRWYFAMPSKWTSNSNSMQKLEKPFPNHVFLKAIKKENHSTVEKGPLACWITTVVQKSRPPIGWNEILHDMRHQNYLQASFSDGATT